MKYTTFLSLLTLELGMLINNWFPWFLVLIGASAPNCEVKYNYIYPWGIGLSGLALLTLLIAYTAKAFKQIRRFPGTPGVEYQRRIDVSAPASVVQGQSFVVRIQVQRFDSPLPAGMGQSFATGQGGSSPAAPSVQVFYGGNRSRQTAGLKVKVKGDGIPKSRHLSQMIPVSPEQLPLVSVPVAVITEGKVRLTVEVSQDGHCLAILFLDLMVSASGSAAEQSITSSLPIVLKPTTGITLDQIDDALRRSAEGQATSIDAQILQYAITSKALRLYKGKNVVADGDRNVIIKGDAEHTTIVTGDGAPVFQFYGPQSEKLIKTLIEADAKSRSVKAKAIFAQLALLFRKRALVLLVLLFVLGFVPPPSKSLPVIRINSIGCVNVSQGIVVSSRPTIKGNFTGDLRPGQSIMVYGQQGKEIGVEYPWKLLGVARAEKGAWELASLALGDTASYDDLHARIVVVLGCNDDFSNALADADLSRLAKNAPVSPQEINFTVANPKLTLTGINGVEAHDGMHVAVSGDISGTIQGSIPTGSKVVAFVSRNTGGYPLEPDGSDNPSGSTWKISNIDFRLSGSPDQTVAEIAVLVMPDNCTPSDRFDNVAPFKLVSVIVPRPTLEITDHSVSGAFTVSGKAANILEGESICVRITGGELAGRKCFLTQGRSEWSITDNPGNRVRNASSYLIEATVTNGEDCCNTTSFAVLAHTKVAGPVQAH